MNLEPVLQVMAYKKVAAETGVTRYRFILSDGSHTWSACIMSGSMAVLTEKGQFEKYSIIKVNKYQLNQAKDTTTAIFVVSDAVTLKPGAEVGAKIGNPMQFKGGAGPTDVSSPAKRPLNGSNSGGSVSAPKKMITSDMIAPISSLHAFNQNWTIKGRIVSKTGIKTWDKPSSSGKLFSFDVSDETSSIRVTAFNKDVDKWFESIQVNKIFILSKFRVKAANKAFNRNGVNDYEISLTEESVVEETGEDHMVPKMKYKFVKISEIEQYQGGSFIDVVGVVRSVGDLTTIVAKATQKELEKREVMIVDDSNGEISLTLWGKDAEDFKGVEGTVLVIKEAKVSEFNNRSLSVGFNYPALLDPEMDVTQKLKNWYSSCQNKGTSFTSLTTATSNRETGLKLLLQGENEATVNRDGVYVTGKIVVGQVGKMTVYFACPHDNCKKKVMDMNNNTYRCNNPSCPSGGADIDNPVPKFVVNLSFSDISLSAWGSLFHDDFMKIMALKAEEAKVLHDQDKLKPLVEEKLGFQSFVVRLRFKQEYYKEEAKVKCSIHRMTPVDWTSYSKDLIKMTQDFAKVL